MGKIMILDSLDVLRIYSARDDIERSIKSLNDSGNFYEKDCLVTALNMIDIAIESLTDKIRSHQE